MITMKSIYLFCNNNSSCHTIVFLGVAKSNKIHQILGHVPIINVDFKKLKTQFHIGSRLLMDLKLNTMELLLPGSQLDQNSRCTEQNVCSRSGMLRDANKNATLNVI